MMVGFPSDDMDVEVVVAIDESLAELGQQLPGGFGIWPVGTVDKKDATHRLINSSGK